MQCMSMIFGCFSRNLAITPPLAPFITLHVSDVKLISMVDGTFQASSPDQKKIPTAERSVIPMVSRCRVTTLALLDSNTRTRTVKSLTASPLSLDSSQRRLNGHARATSITGFSMASQMMAFVFVCLQENPAAIFESVNMAETISDK